MYTAIANRPAFPGNVITPTSLVDPLKPWTVPVVPVLWATIVPEDRLQSLPPVHQTLTRPEPNEQSMVPILILELLLGWRCRSRPRSSSHRQNHASHTSSCTCAAAEFDRGLPTGLCLVQARISQVFHPTLQVVSQFTIQIAFHPDTPKPNEIEKSSHGLLKSQSFGRVHRRGAAGGNKCRAKCR